MYIILSITFTVTEDGLISHSRSYNWTKCNICRWICAHLFFAHMPRKAWNRLLSLFCSQNFWTNWKNNLVFRCQRLHSLRTKSNENNTPTLLYKFMGRAKFQRKFDLEISSVNNFSRLTMLYWEAYTLKFIKICSETTYSKNSYHIETSQLIWTAKQLTGCYMTQDFTERCFRADISYIFS